MDYPSRIYIKLPQNKVALEVSLFWEISLHFQSNYSLICSARESIFTRTLAASAVSGIYAQAVLILTQLRKRSGNQS
jgi:hypothetical protein